MIYTSSRPYPRHSRRVNPRHNRRMTRAQQREWLAFLRVLTVGAGVFLAMAGAGPDPAEIANLPLSIFGTVLAMAAALGLVDNNAERR